MNFNDIFKSNFLENVDSVSLLDMGIALILAFCLGLFIFMIYKKCICKILFFQGLILYFRTCALVEHLNSLTLPNPVSAIK